MEIEALIGVAAIGVPILGAILVTAWRGGARIQQLSDWYNSLDSRIARIEAEFVPNGGRSLKDRIEAGILLEEKTLRHIDRLERKLDKNDRPAN